MRILLKPEALNAFGPVIKRIREQARPVITQQDIAARVTRLGIYMDRSAVSRIENQKRSLTDRELILFAAALKVPVGYIFRIADEMTRLIQRRAESIYENAEVLYAIVAEDPPEY